MVQSAMIPAETFGEVSRNWGWLLALGILFVILGTIGLGMTFTLTVVSVLFFGVLMLIGGGAQLVQAFQNKGWKSVVWHVLIALLYIAAGIIVMRNPVGASLLLTAMLAGALVAVGVVRIIMAFQLRGDSGWVWLLLGGVVTLLLGLMIFSKWPVSGLWVIGLFVAIEMIVNGWSYVAIALAARRAGKAAGSAAA